MMTAYRGTAMTGEHDKERQRAIDTVRPHGWHEAGVNPKTGYTKMHCACGDHTVWLPKTPSHRNTYRRKANHMISLCSVRE
jgi:hypothetical protein